MSDSEPTSDPVPPPVIEHAPAPAVAVVRRRGGTPLLLTLLLTAGLGGAIYWVWTHPNGAPAQAAADSQPAIEAARAQIMAAVQSQTQALSGRVDALEKAARAPAPAQGVGQEAVADASKKLDELSGRVDALSAKQDAQAAEIQKAGEIASQRPPETAPPPPDTTAAQVPALVAGQQAADMGSKLDRQKAAEDDALAQQKSTMDDLQQRLAKLEAAPGQADAARQQAGQQQAQDEAKAGAQVEALAARVDRVEQGLRQSQLPAQNQAQNQAQTQAQTQALAQVAALGARIDKLELGTGQAQSQEQAQAKTTEQGEAEARTQLAALTTRVEKLEQGEGQVQGVARNASRAVRIEEAQAALQSGQPLGALPDAPPALSRFATVAPPTESGLRAAFPQVAEAARAASQPDLSNRSFLDRALARVQQSVTVRRGDRVLVGDPAAGVLARAQDALNAGDLKRAADTLGALDGPAAAAASNWVAQARSLVEARAALAAMAHS